MSSRTELDTVAAPAELAEAGMTGGELAAIAAVAHFVSLYERLPHFTAWPNPERRIEAVAINGLVVEKEEQFGCLFLHGSADVCEPALRGRSDEHPETIPLEELGKLAT